MSTTTTNFKLVKPALTDAPPDITAMNPNWDTIDAELLKITPIVTTAGTSTAYTATAKQITSLTTGIKIIIIPHIASGSTTPTLNVNGLGAKQIRRRLSNITTSPQAGYANTWLAKDKPFTLVYDGTYWIYEDGSKPSASDLYGSVPVANGGTGANNAADARTNLEITPANIGAATSSHNQAASTITEGTFPTTAIYAKSGTDYTTARIRNIYANTSAMTAKSTSLTSGNIYLQYE